MSVHFALIEMLTNLKMCKFKSLGNLIILAHIYHAIIILWYRGCSCCTILNLKRLVSMILCLQLSKHNMRDIWVISRRGILIIRFMKRFWKNPCILILVLLLYWIICTWSSITSKKVKICFSTIICMDLKFNFELFGKNEKYFVNQLFWSEAWRWKKSFHFPFG